VPDSNTLCLLDMQPEISNIKTVNLNAKALALSVFKGTGMDAYYEFVMGVCYTRLRDGFSRI
jgi:hypothetical protein